MIAVLLTRDSKALLVLSTVIIAVSAARIAANASEMGSWLVITGAAITLFSSESGREIEDDARELYRVSQVPIKTARWDLFNSGDHKVLAAWFAMGAVLIVAGVVVQSL